jgi:hypothetical protein
VSNEGAIPKGIKEFLKTDQGNELMSRYGYQSQFAVDNVVHKYKDYV